MKVPFLRSIGAKLFGLIMICMVMAVLGVSLQNHGYFRTYLDTQIADDMVRQAQEAGNSVEAVIENWTGQIALTMHGLDRQDRAQWPEFAQGFVASNRELVAFEVFEDGASGLESKVFAWTPNGEEEKRFDDKDPKALAGKLQELTGGWVKELKGKDTAGRRMFLKNVAPALGAPLLSISIPFEAKADGSRLWAALTVWQTRLAAALPKSQQIESFMVDQDGKVFVSQAVQAVVEARSLKDSELTRAALSGDAPYGFRKLERQDGNASLGAYCSLANLGMSIVMERDARQAYLAVDSILKRTALWVWLFVLVSVLLSYFVASGMTKNIRLVAQSTQKVAGGDFEGLTMPKSRDEIGGLGQSVQYMAKQIQGLLKDSVEKARMATELDTAHMVQKTFIPDQSIDCGKLKITGRHQTASECGGDWWGHFNLAPGLDFLCIADATGHGVPAALITAMVYSSATIIAQNVKRSQAKLSPIDVLQQVNSLLWLAGNGRLTLTFLAAVIDSNTGEVTIANAGHNFPAVIPRREDDERLAKREDAVRRRYKQLIVRGGILGMYEAAVATEKSFHLKPGDKLLFYTDGMTECKGADGNAWGLLGLNKALTQLADAPIDDMKRGLIETVLAFNGAAPLADDVTVVVAEWPEQAEAVRAAS